MKPTKQNPKTICMDCEFLKEIKGTSGATFGLDTLYCTCPGFELTERRHYVTGAPMWFDERWETPKESSGPYPLCKDRNNGNCSLFEPAAA